MTGCTYADVLRIEFSSSQIVHNLVGSEEGESVGEVLEVLNDAEDSREVIGVVGRPWLCSIDALTRERRIDIEDHVDTGGIEDGGARRVVERRVDIVDTNGVDLCMISSSAPMTSAALVRTPSFCITVASLRHTSASVNASLPSWGLYAP